MANFINHLSIGFSLIYWLDDAADVSIEILFIKKSHNIRIAIGKY